MFEQLKMWYSLFERLVVAVEKMVPQGEKEAPKPPKTSKKVTQTDTVPPVPASTASPATPPAASQSNVEQPTNTPKDEDDDFGAPAKPAEKPITADDIRALGSKLAAAKGEEVPKNIIKTIGNSPNIKNMDPSKYAAVVKAMEEALK